MSTQPFGAKWLVELGKFVASIPPLGPVSAGDETWMDGSITIYDHNDKPMAKVTWDHESEGWAIVLESEPES